ncbi:MAG: Mu transposase C-terminal domain-containing protein [Phycisphaerales bacterium]|nr:Mu transposase C-terminal domain-containing protein [Phycisphaerales bacterium]
MKITVNLVIEWQSADADSAACTERVLWVSPSRSEVIVIDIFNQTALPFRRSYDEVAHALAVGAASALGVDPFMALLRSDDDLDVKHRAYRDTAWGLIAPLVSNEMTALQLYSSQRGSLIKRHCDETGRSKSLVYKYLRQYWQAGQIKNALLPSFDKCGGRGKRRLAATAQAQKLGRPSARSRNTGEQIGVRVTPEIERKFERGINRFYETREGRSLRDAYDLTQEAFFHDGYTIVDGTPAPLLLPAEMRPSFDQFRYWYENHYRELRREQRARRGERAYNLEMRELLGDSTQMALGPGSVYQIDATIGDIYLVSSLDRSRIIGRPVIYACVDVFSRMIAGVAVTLEGPSWLGAMLALDNVIEDKASFCAGYGIEITEGNWPCHHLPEAILADRGEFEGYAADSLAHALGIRMHNTPPYRADLKGIVERRFRIANEKFIHFMPGAVARPRQRGEADYRLDAVLTLDEFRKLLICYILDYNAHHYLSEYRKNEFMIADQVERYPLDLWEWGVRNCSGHLRTLPQEIVRLNLLPRKTVSVTGAGIDFEGGLYYTCELALREGWFARARSHHRQRVEVSYDPRTLDRIYLRLDGGRRLEPCHLTPASSKTFSGRDWHEIVDHFALESQVKDAARTEIAQSKALRHAQQKQIVADATEKTRAAQAALGRQSKRARTRGIIANRELERQNERDRDGWRLGTKEPDLSPPIPPAADDQEEGYVPPISKVSRIRELRDKEWNKR